MSTHPDILIVDDEEIVRETLGEYLKELGCKVDWALDGVTALEAAQQQAYSLVLVDIRMPGMDGLSLLSRLRELRPDLPVAMMTGHGDPSVTEDAESLGAVDLLLKPVRLHDLDALLSRLGLLPSTGDPASGSGS